MDKRVEFDDVEKGNVVSDRNEKMNFGVKRLDNWVGGKGRGEVNK